MGSSKLTFEEGSTNRMLSSKLCLYFVGVSTIQGQIMDKAPSYSKEEDRKLEKTMKWIDDRVAYKKRFLSDDYYQLIYEQKENLKRIVEKSSTSTAEEEILQNIATSIATQEQLRDILGKPKNLNEERMLTEIYNHIWHQKDKLEKFYQSMAKHERIKQNNILQDWMTENIFYLILGIIIFSLITLILFYILSIEDFSNNKNPQIEQSPKAKRYKKKRKKSKNEHIFTNPSPISTNTPDDDTEADDCLICLDILEDNLFYLEPCGHEYHRDCIKLWVVKEGTCPKCGAAAV